MPDASSSAGARQIRRLSCLCVDCMMLRICDYKIMNIDVVAKLAGVSPATVSRVLNGTAPVHPEKAERVRHAVAALGFVPNTAARALAGWKSGLFGLIISDITNPYFPDLVKAFEDVALEHGCEVIIGDTNYDPHRMAACVKRMLQRQVDGVAIMTSELDEGSLQMLEQKAIPTVFMDTGKLEKKVNVVRVEYAAGVDMAVEHLLELGHQKIGFIAGPSSLPSASLRLRAFKHAIKSRELDSRAEWLYQGDHRVSGGVRAATRLLKDPHRPTALVCSNDLTAIGALGALSDAGVQVPEEFSIIGFDDIEISSYVKPGLTTLRVPRSQMASAAFRMLLEQGSDDAKTSVEERCFSPTLILRGSTGAPAVTGTRKKRK